LEQANDDEQAKTSSKKSLAQDKRVADPSLENLDHMMDDELRAREVYHDDARSYLDGNMPLKAGRKK